MADILDTIVIAFGEEVSDTEAAGFYGKVLLDYVLNLDSSGEVKTSFGPKEPCHLLCHLKPGWTISRVESTDGEVQLFALVERDYTQEKLFFSTSENQKNLDFFPSRGITHSWYGNESEIIAVERSITAPSAPVIGDLTYSFFANSLTLTPPPGLTLADSESWPIGVVITVVKS